METSPFIQKAKDLIKAISGKHLSLEERKVKAIDLAALMLKEAERIQTPDERNRQALLAGMMRDPIGKPFTTSLTDECFRSRRPERIADQLTYLIKHLGIPEYLPMTKKLSLQAFAAVGEKFSSLAVPMAVEMIRSETSSVILPGEDELLSRHMNRRRLEGVRINLNRLGEAILGEEEAERRLNVYLNDLANPEVEYISIKISTIFSQINLLAWNDCLEVLSERLRLLYRAAMANKYERPDGSSASKFVNLDMEEYRDLHLTVDLFRKVLDEPEFYRHEAGIVLQSYLPDSFLIQQELTLWAMQRHIQGGAPIKIRIVKGANLAMEQIESALRLWPQAPYSSKNAVDANFKRMISYGCSKEHAQSVHLGIGSHNLFDIAYALLLRAENEVEECVSFEMLEGMADHMRRVVQEIAGSMLLYCPAATEEEFQNAVAYLVRRLDENTAPQNFLRQAFDLKPGTKEWKEQAQLFSDSCELSNKLDILPNRIQNRLYETTPSGTTSDFENESDTDWSLIQNRRWAESILERWKGMVHPDIPLMIGGKEIHLENGKASAEDPSSPGKILYRYSCATEDLADKAVESAKQTEAAWFLTPPDQRTALLKQAADELRKNRADLIGAMIADTGKILSEADNEVSEAIDFIEYYRLNLLHWQALQDISWKPKGTVLVTPPWNFPCSIPVGGIAASLAAGNCVIFKPPPESVLVGWHLVQLFWKAGISPSVLQFIVCDDEPVGSRLIADERISTIVLTGATSTAQHFLKLRPGLDLMAETGGKNTLIITSMSDRDLAIKDLLQSAFGHSGQKCSACSLAILEAEVYDDLHFRQQLRGAAASLTVGSPWNLKTKINPLIHPPAQTLLKGLTTLEPHEEWLLEPRQDPQNPQLWSPGIKLGVKPGSFTFQNELFGPVLGLVRAETVDEAFSLMNQTCYGLTAGIHSLDEREQKKWLEQIEAGNCYINRTITGAIVQRQPFGGCKNSSFGKGCKAGGPNYLAELMQPTQIATPEHKLPPQPKVVALSRAVQDLTQLEQNLFDASIESYAFHWETHFSKQHDPSLVLGQDNLFSYIPHPLMVLRAQKGDSYLDLLRFIAAALTCGTPLEITVEDANTAEKLVMACSGEVPVLCESDHSFAERLAAGEIKRVRVLQKPPQLILHALADNSCNLHQGAVLANGRLELLHLLREVSISRDYHRYGNLGLREEEKRSPLPKTPNESLQEIQETP